jgi:AcrR family transcriptional regulator
MSNQVTSRAPRGRSDAVRNRERLLEVSRDAFSAGDGDIALETLAKRAGVGIGTLYRNFPTREALVEALYRSELDALAATVDEALSAETADAALRLWMDRYATFVATKHGMAESLQGLFSTGAMAPSETRTRVREAVARFLEAGASDGTLRSDVQADDVVSMLVDTFLSTAGAPDKQQRDRMLGLIIDSIRSR